MHHLWTGGTSLARRLRRFIDALIITVRAVLPPTHDCNDHAGAHRTALAYGSDPDHEIDGRGR